MDAKKQQKLVVFDFDGVLVDTLGINFEINKETQPDLTLDEYKSFLEGNIHEAIASGRKKAIPDFNDKFRARTRQLKIPMILKEILHDLSSKYILTIVSSSSDNIIKEITERENVSNFFADILGSEINKNKVLKIKMLFDKYGAKPENAIFITDTLGDIREASECNVRSIAITWGFHDKATLLKGNPFAIIDDPRALVPTIEKILLNSI